MRVFIILIGLTIGLHIIHVLQIIALFSLCLAFDVSCAFQLPVEGSVAERERASGYGTRSRIHFPVFSCLFYKFFSLHWIASPNTLFLFAFTVDCARDMTLVLGDLWLLIISSDVTLSYSRFTFCYARDRASVTARQSHGYIDAGVNPLTLLSNGCTWFTWLTTVRNT